MGSKLSNENRLVLCMKDLKDGQIAEIIDTRYYTGALIQRYKDDCVSIGERAGLGFSNIKLNTLAIRILENGELITIFNNR